METSGLQKEASSLASKYQSFPGVPSEEFAEASPVDGSGLFWWSDSPTFVLGQENRSIVEGEIVAKEHSAFDIPNDAQDATRCKGN